MSSVNPVAVLGVGLIGGSVGLAVRENLPDTEVRGFDVAEGVLERALTMGAITEPCDSIKDAVAGAKVCIIACPVGKLAEVVREALEYSDEDCVVSDVGSVKAAVIESLDGDEDRRFIGGHPLAGAEAAGVEHAVARLFKGGVWYLTPTEKTEGMLYERLYRLIADIGARPQAIDADTHDRLMATVSHLPHVLANVLADQAASTLAEEGERLPATGPSFRDMTRVAGSNPSIWTDIFLENSEAVARETDALARMLDDVTTVLRSGDRNAVDEWILNAREHRKHLLAPQLDGEKIFQLRVPVPNKPGVLAKLSLALSEAGVNIADMNLYPAPDMSSGAISLWIAGVDQVKKAEEVVSGLGYPAVRVDTGTA